MPCFLNNKLIHVGLHPSTNIDFRNGGFSRHEPQANIDKTSPI